jgi:type III secretion protein L
VTLSRARVVPAAEAHGARPVPGDNSAGGDDQTTTAARVVPAALVAAHDEAREVLARARAQADLLVGEARDAAGSARAEAEREGAAAAEARLAAGFIRLIQAEQSWARDREQGLVDVARALAERLLGRALELDPSLVADLAREALRSVARARRVALFVHPDDEAPLRARLGELGLSAHVLEVHVDPSRPRGSLLADTDLGTLDAQLAPQLDRLVSALRR